MADTLFIVVPCYNEEDVLPETAKQLKKKITELVEKNLISSKSRIVFVNDGSGDHTWEIITQLYENDTLYSGINLSCNRGHQNALLAGLMISKDYSDMVISLDADLQDDIQAFDEMIEKYYLGNDIVYGVREDRTTDTVFKRNTARGYYTLLNALGAHIVFNHADYRLMSKRSLDELENYKEVNLFLRGIIPLIGFPSDIVTYSRKKRFAGESKYPIKKMITFALEGITSLSTKPIRMITGIGTSVFLISILMLIYFFIRYATNNTVPGWASIAVSVWAIGGLQLLSIGIIGEYIGKIYLETKNRPRYIVQEFLHHEKDI